MKTAWVSGASSGLGLHIALALEKHGYTVVGGARSFNMENSAKPEISYCLPLDVTSEESAQSFVNKALSLASAPSVMVNAAGILNLGPAENYTEDELKSVMDVCFFGAARMTRLALPYLRKTKGTIVNMSSINGVLATPFEGAYSAAKHALEGFSEALAMETHSQGVNVMVVEPGDHRGGQKRYRAHASNVDPIYKMDYENTVSTIEHDEREGLFPEELGEKVAKALNKKRPPYRLKVASFTQLLAVRLHKILPPSLFFKIMRKYYGMK